MTSTFSSITNNVPPTHVFEKQPVKKLINTVASAKVVIVMCRYNSSIVKYTRAMKTAVIDNLREIMKNERLANNESFSYAVQGDTVYIDLD